MKIGFSKIFSWEVVMVLALTAVAAPVFGEDYKEISQNKALYGMVAEWYANRSDAHYAFFSSELTRYGQMLVMDHDDSMEFIRDRVWTVRKGFWQKDRNEKGLYVPRKNITKYLCLLLEDNGCSVSATSNVINHPLWYEAVRTK